MWMCRAIPPAFWISLALVITLDWSEGEHVVILLPWIVLALAYFVLVLMIMPVLLFEGNFRYKWVTLWILPEPFWFALFAVPTLGIGPTIWYWIKVDPILRKMNAIDTCEIGQNEPRKQDFQSGPRD